MQIYYSSLKKIQQQTMQLENERCIHCGKKHQLVSHGFIYKKLATSATPEPIGKRALCSNRYGRLGCGRTMQLYLESRVRYLHYAGSSVVAFVLSLMDGNTVEQAYQQVTGAAYPRNAYRWLDKLFARLSDYRSLPHKPELADESNPPGGVVQLQARQRLLAQTFRALSQHFGEYICESYQQTLQASFL